MKKILYITALLAAAFTHFSPDTYIGEYHTRGIYITYDTGYMINEYGDGICTTKGICECHNYIAYNPDRFNPGDTITTVYLYNPFTTYGDDIIARFDF